MSTINDFDESIKRQFLKGAPILPEVYADKEECYGREITIRGKKNIYDTYFNEELGEKILQIIDKGIEQRYKDGKGGEFKYKFFSVASSSRFAVASFSNNVSDKIMYINQYSGEEISEILFEKNLPINNISGTPPQMDVWIKTSHDIFFEVKCHEIFEESQHANIKISTQYSNNRIFNEIINYYSIDLSTRKQTYVKEGKVKSYYLLNRNMFKVSTQTAHFDMKQFICHLMGIISYKEKANSVVEFNYLFYKNDDKQFNKVYIELENEISVIMKSFKWLFSKYNIKFSCFYNSRFSTLERPLPFMMIS
jgi:hypothetical protein